MCSRSRTGGGPPSGAALDEKKRETEKVEQGGEATIAAYEPDLQRSSRPVRPDCDKKAAIPSGLFVGPENRRRAVRDERARSRNSGRGCSGSRDGSMCSGAGTDGKPLARPSSGSGGRATASESICCPSGRQGYVDSSK
eukprot:2948427-Pleurochrysis_carterae.AAC.1